MDDAKRRQERLRRRTTRMDGMFSFTSGGKPEESSEAIYTRGEAEQRASTILAGSIKALPDLVVEASKPAGPEQEGLEAAIDKDPELAALVLAAGGSEFFRRGGERPTNLGVLIERAGTAAFRNITLTVTLYRELAQPLPWYGYDAHGLWRHTIAAAVSAWKLSNTLGFHAVASELVFLGALFHDIGKPTIQGLMDFRAPDAEQASQGRQLPVLETERRVVSLTHCELVPLILDIWGVEHSIFGIAEHHHAPQRAGTHAIQATIVQLADVLANRAGIGLEREYPFAEAALDKTAARLNVDLNVCRSIQEKLGMDVAEIAMEVEGPS